MVHQVERIKKINELINSANTGSPKEFADKLGISKSHLYQSIEELNEMGISIHYGSTRKAYYYENIIEHSLSYSMKIISENGVKEIIGGYKIIPYLLLYESAHL